MRIECVRLDDFVLKLVQPNSLLFGVVNNLFSKLLQFLHNVIILVLLFCVDTLLELLCVLDGFLNEELQVVYFFVLQ